MKSRGTKESRSHLFAVELHSERPQEMVQFYEKLLSIKFKSTTYPFPRSIAEFGRVALIISDSREQDIGARSPQGKVTLEFIHNDPLANDALKYYLHSKRPIGGAFPARYAQRMADPEGNCVALAPSMENVFGRVPTVSTFRDLARCIGDYRSVLLERARQRLRTFMDRAIDHLEYTSDDVTFFNRDIRGYTHIVASREGLFLVNSESQRRVLRGSFFGMTIKDNSVYCFQSCGRIGETDNKGRILKLSINNNRIESADVFVKGLDDGCHQIDFIGEDLVVVDCFNGRLLQIKPGVKDPIAHYPLGRLSREMAKDHYHMNSLAGHPDGTLWVLLHNSLKNPSEVIVLNGDYEIVRRFTVAAGAAHNITFTNDESQYLIADSAAGRVISKEFPVIHGDMMMTRGVSLDNEICVVGDSFFSTRPFRRYVPGRVHFFDRMSWARKSSVLMPGAPTEIRRIDGHDLSITNFIRAQTNTEFSN